MLEIRPLLPGQWPLLKAVRLRALADAPEAFTATLAQAQKYSEDDWQTRSQRSLLLPPAVTFLAFSENVPCGMTGCFVSPEDNKVAEMTAFWVAPESRGQGVGEALVVSVANWASTHGVTVLHAWVVEDNQRAIGFYHKVGFSETEQRQPHTPDPAKRIMRMVRRLESA